MRPSATTTDFVSVVLNTEDKSPVQQAVHYYGSYTLVSRTVSLSVPKLPHFSQYLFATRLQE